MKNAFVGLLLCGAMLAVVVGGDPRSDARREALETLGQLEDHSDARRVFFDTFDRVMSETIAADRAEVGAGDAVPPPDTLAARVARLESQVAELQRQRKTEPPDRDVQTGPNDSD